MSIKIPMTWKCDPVPSETQLLVVGGKEGTVCGKTFPTEEEAKEAMQSIGKSIANGIVMGREVALFSWLERDDAKWFGLMCACQNPLGWWWSSWE
jgi:hypothetical protein